MEEIKLVIPKEEYEKAVLGYKNECLSGEEKLIHGDGGLDTIDSYNDWLKKINDASRIETCPNDLVPATTYIAIRELDNKVIGTLQIRHYLNDFLLREGGHIGYEVRPSERRKGYATEMLRLALKECLILGIKKVLLICDKSNLASAKTIQNQGGILENEVLLKNDMWIQRYWINLAKSL